MGKFSLPVTDDKLVSEITTEAITTTSEVITKSKEEKDAVMKFDMATMSSYGLYYDYANLTLEEVVKEFMKEHGIKGDQIAFSYKDLTSKELISYNETMPMRAGSTYKLPLSMLIKDKVDDGELSMTKRYDISKTSFELASEKRAYMKQFGGAMRISDMWEYALLYSENTPAHKMAELLGGFEAAFAQYSKYGKSTKASIETFDYKAGNYTTTDYYIQLLEYLYNNQTKYKEIIKNIEASFPGEYYKRYIRGIRVAQKPGFSKEAINASAIVFEKKPYIVAVYTKYLGKSNENTVEIDYQGLTMVGKLTYVINQWHRVNKN